MPVLTKRLHPDDVLQRMAPLLHGSAGAAAVLVHRLDAVLLVCGGFDVHRVATLFGVHSRTVQRWVHAAEAGAAPDRRKPGRHALLSNVQLEDVRLMLAAGTRPGLPWTGKRLRLYLETHGGMRLSLRSCQRLLARSRLTG